jgi:hypothetical protein
MLVEIINGYHQPETKVTRENKPYYVQKAFVHNGGAFPVEFEMRIESPAHAYQVGKFEIDPASFRVNQYKKLEISPFDLKLKPLNQAQLKDAKAV